MEKEKATSNLILIRGVQGAGKTTFATLLSSLSENVVAFAADDFLIDEEGNYAYSPERLGMAHRLCQEATQRALEQVPGINVIVHNTFSREREMAPYFELAEKTGAKVTVVIIENRHGNKDVHNVPDEVRKALADRLRSSIKLI